MFSPGCAQVEGPGLSDGVTEAQPLHIQEHLEEQIHHVLSKRQRGLFMMEGQGSICISEEYSARTEH